MAVLWHGVVGGEVTEATPESLLVSPNPFPLLSRQERRNNKKLPPFFIVGTPTSLGLYSSHYCHWSFKSRLIVHLKRNKIYHK